MDDQKFQQLREALLAEARPEDLLAEFELSELSAPQQETLALDLEVAGLLSSGGRDFEGGILSAGLGRSGAGRRRLFAAAAAAAIAVACLAVAATWLLQPDRSRPAPSITTRAFDFRPHASGSPELPSQLATQIYRRALEVATITRSGKGGEVVTPQPLPPGVLDLHEGWLELSFPEVAVVRLHAPATLEILGSSSAFLHRGSLTVRDSGRNGRFTVYHASGKIIDIATAFAVKVDGGDAVDVYVQEGTVDVYDGSELSLQRLHEGQQVVAADGTTSLDEPGAPPAWVPETGAPDPAKEPADSATPILTAAWLQGESGSGEAAGSLGGIAVDLETEAAANGGGIFPVAWASYLPGLSPAETWYHPESVSIAAPPTIAGSPGSFPVTVRFAAEVEGPVLLFAWGEAGLQVDLGDHEIAEDGASFAHPSITFDGAILDFGDEPDRQNIPGQAAAIRLAGSYGQGRPLRFQLVSSLPRAESIAFSVALPSESPDPEP